MPSSEEVANRRLGEIVKDGIKGVIAKRTIQQVVAAERTEFLSEVRKVAEGNVAGLGVNFYFDLGVMFQGTPGARHMNPLGTVHGGWFATLLDSALGCSIHTRMEPGRGYTTAELGINLVKAITPKVQRVRAEGRVIHSGRQLATAEARLVGPDGTLYAHATTTCLVFDLPAQSKG